MSVRLTSQENRVALFDSVSGFAFGPTFMDEREAEHFITWLRPRDARELSASALNTAYAEWLAERDAV